MFKSSSWFLSPLVFNKIVSKAFKNVKEEVIPGFFIPEVFRVVIDYAITVLEELAPPRDTD